jgi:hypothetical protein
MSSAVMLNVHVAPGLFVLVVTIAFSGTRYFRAPKQQRLPWWGWTGLATILASEFLNFRHVYWVTIFFTPLAWTGYVLLVDALVACLKGESLLSATPGRFFSLTFWSVPLWLIFEAYNLRLQNWEYVGLPESVAIRGFGYVWSFATIWPAIFETAELVEALAMFRHEGKRRTPVTSATRWGLLVTGLAFAVVPVAVPASLGRYLFGAVWVGFVLFLDPLNYRWNGFSFLREFESGRNTTFWSFLVAGWICGIFWEFWNYWAGAKWMYIFPIGQGWKVFEMPLAGYLGFLPFALECKVMFEFVQTLRTRLLQERRIPSWDAARSHTA